MKLTKPTRPRKISHKRIDVRQIPGPSGLCTGLCSIIVESLLYGVNRSERHFNVIAREGHSNVTAHEEAANMFV